MTKVVVDFHHAWNQVRLSPALLLFFCTAIAVLLHVIDTEISKIMCRWTVGRVCLREVTAAPRTQRCFIHLCAVFAGTTARHSPFALMNAIRWRTFC